MLRTQKEQNTNERPDTPPAQLNAVIDSRGTAIRELNDRLRTTCGAELILIPIAGFVISALCEAYGLGWRLAVHWRSELVEANGSPRVPRVSPTSKTETQEQAHV